jgi:hypothetical protein
MHHTKRETKLKIIVAADYLPAVFRVLCVRHILGGLAEPPSLGRNFLKYEN